MALIKLNPTKCMKCGRMNNGKTKILTKRTQHFRITCDSCGHTYFVELTGTNKPQIKSPNENVS